MQDFFRLFKPAPLQGDVKAYTKNEFEILYWWNGDFQAKREEYLNHEFGTSAFFVRLHNQIFYSLMGKINVKEVVEGKDGYLFERSYIRAFSGKDFIGNDSIIDRIGKLQFISDTLSKLGKKLIVILAPGKATFCAEFMPDNIYKSEVTNYSVFSRGLSLTRVATLDFQNWFMQMKSSSRHPLFPKQGIHWSMYGAALAVDSILSFIDTSTDYKTATYSIREGLDEPAKEIDNDIGASLNLLFPLQGSLMHYPEVIIDSLPQNKAPKVLTIGDSYYWTLEKMGFARAVKSVHFWYYNRLVYPESEFANVKCIDQDLGETFAEHDVFIFLATEANLKKFGWGLIDDAHSFFKGDHETLNDTRGYKKKIDDMIEYIKTDDKWFYDVKRRASEEHVSIDSMLVRDARWVLANEKK